MNNFAKNLLLLSTLLTVSGTTESWGWETGTRTNRQSYEDQQQLPTETFSETTSVKVMARKGAQFTLKAAAESVLFTGATEVAETEKSTEVEISSNLLNGEIMMASDKGGMVSTEGGRIGYKVTFWDTELAPAEDKKQSDDAIIVPFGTVSLKKKITFTIDNKDFKAAKEGLYSDTLRLTLTGK